MVYQSSPDFTHRNYSGIHTWLESKVPSGLVVAKKVLARCNEPNQFIRLGKARLAHKGETRQDNGVVKTLI
jgi:hypothetical protein